MITVIRKPSVEYYTHQVYVNNKFFSSEVYFDMDSKMLLMEEWPKFNIAELKTMLAIDFPEGILFGWTQCPMSDKLFDGFDVMRDEDCIEIKVTSCCDEALLKRRILWDPNVYVMEMSKASRKRGHVSQIYSVPYSMSIHFKYEAEGFLVQLYQRAMTETRQMHEEVEANLRKMVAGHKGK